MFDNIVLLMTNAFEIYVIYKFLGNIWGKVCVSRWVAVAMYGIRYMVTSIVMIYMPYAIVNMLSNVLTILMIAFCYRCSISKKVTVSIFIILLLFISEAIVAGIIGLTNFSTTERTMENVGVCVSVMDVIMFGLLILLVERFINLSVDIKTPKLFTFSIILVSATSVVLLSVVFQQQSINYVFMIISLICVLVSSFTIIYLYDSIVKLFDEKTKSEFMKRERTYYHNQSILLQKNSNDLREFRHDINNKLMVIKQYAENNEIEQLKKYISEISGKLIKNNVYSVSGNFAVDSIINYKLSQAAEKGIEVTADITIPEIIGVEDDDMVVILGNLLDNAIEATSQLKDNKYINIMLKMKNDSIFLNVENSHNNKINIKGQTILTTKEGKRLHGIGLSSVKNTIYKYHGIIEMEYDDNKFEVTVIL